MLHGRFTNVGQPAAWIVLDIVRLENGRLAEHWMSSRTRPHALRRAAACQCLARSFPIRCYLAIVWQRLRGPNPTLDDSLLSTLDSTDGRNTLDTA